MLLLLFSLLLLLITEPAYANAILPNIINWPGIYLAITFTVGFLLEYMCICILIHARTARLFLQASWCTLFMNLASTFVGAILRIPLAIFYVIFLDKINRLAAHTIAINEAIYLIGIYFIYVIINTIIEAYITEYYFPKISRKRVWLWVFIANCLSMGAIAVVIYVLDIIK